MKIRFFALVGIFLAITLSPAKADVYSLEQSALTQQPNNYVVIGAFAHRKNAVKFAALANRVVGQLNLKAAFELNLNRNLYYVYVLITEDHEKAINEANRVRSETEFADTWVYHGPFVKVENDEQAMRAVDINPENNQHIDIDQPGTDNKPDSATQQTITASTENVSPQIVEETKPKNAPPDKDDINGKTFVLKLFRGVDNAEVQGDVDAIDVDRTRKMGTYKGNMPVKISSPNSKSGGVSLVCEVFGYRKVQHDINYNQPTGDEITVDSDNDIVIPFELTRLQKGDIAVMYNVYFFKDAGIMRPESRYEINSLLEMLKENPKYKIKIHGHTNGSAPGKIISVGDSKNYFSLSNTKESVGSAKKLSEERANVIKEYLVNSGIDPHRMQVKAWGGKKPIQDKHSTRAQENVRVEIEILEN
jgi:outer membrane protein OmpA-like peptidoglycan-associated protein